jgi:hypothetical protein
MFRHYRVILRQLAINTLPSYTSTSSAAVGYTAVGYTAVGNTVHNFEVI